MIWCAVFTNGSVVLADRNSSTGGLGLSFVAAVARRGRVTLLRRSCCASVEGTTENQASGNAPCTTNWRRPAWLDPLDLEHRCNDYGSGCKNRTNHSTTRRISAVADYDKPKRAPRRNRNMGLRWQLDEKRWLKLEADCDEPDNRTGLGKRARLRTP